MRILKVWDYEYPWDVRTEKVCRALTEMGHDVHLLARNRRGDAENEVLPEASVHRLRSLETFGSRFDAFSQFPAFFNPRWVRLAERVADAQEVEAVIVRDLPLAPLACWVASRRGLPVVLDMAENYGAMIRDLWQTGATRIGDALIRNPHAVDAIERWVLDRVDHTVVVVEESRDRLRRLGVPAEHVSVVSNTPSLDRLDRFRQLTQSRAKRPVDSPPELAGAPLRVGYLGVMEVARGVGELIEAIALAKRAGAPMRLDLIGDGRARPAFESRARELGLTEEQCTFHGFVKYEQALDILAHLDVGIIPHYANESWETTIPNKLFDYMSLGLPVVSSDVSPVHRILMETGAGVTFHDRDVHDLARILREMQALGDRRRMGRCGVAAVRDRFHWERDAEVLRRVISQLESS